MAFFITSSTQRRNGSISNLETDFYKTLKNAFFGKTTENVRIEFKIKLLKENKGKEIIRQQSKLTFNETHKCYTNYDSNIFNQNDFFMDKSIDIGFARLEMSNLSMYEA